MLTSCFIYLLQKANYGRMKRCVTLPFSLKVSPENEADLNNCPCSGSQMTSLVLLRLAYFKRIAI